MWDWELPQVFQLVEKFISSFHFSIPLERIDVDSACMEGIISGRQLFHRLDVGDWQVEHKDESSPQHLQENAMQRLEWQAWTYRLWKMFSI